MTQHWTLAQLACLILAIGAGGPLSAQQHAATTPALTAKLHSPDLADRAQPARADHGQSGGVMGLKDVLLRDLNQPCGANAIPKITEAC